MSVPRKVAGGVAALTVLGALSATPTGATPGSCVLTAQPWNTTTYALDVIHADGTTETLLEQTYQHLDPTSWTIPASIVEVRWAKDPAGVFYDRLTVAPGECRFTSDYANTVIDGVTMPDSVTITPLPAPTPTTSTTTVTPTTSTITVDVTTPAPVPTVDIPLTPTPTSTTSTTWMGVAGPVPRLPDTGSHTRFLMWIGMSALAAGAGLLRLSSRGRRG